MGMMASEHRGRPSLWTRREFLRNTAVASVAAAAGPGGGAAQGKDVRFSGTNLPVIAHADVVIAGGSFAAVVAAQTLARAGKKGVLVESRTYLGRELTATIRPWIRGPGTRPHAIKLDLENRLLDAGVDLLYGSHPVQILLGRGLVIGNKSGRQVVRAGPPPGERESVRSPQWPRGAGPTGRGQGERRAARGRAQGESGRAKVLLQSSRAGRGSPFPSTSPPSLHATKNSGAVPLIFSHSAS